MTVNLNKVHIFIRPGATDLRNQINGLSKIVKKEMKKEPFNGDIYVFCNRDQNAIKILHWDKNGFWIYHKKFQNGFVPWPDEYRKVTELNKDELLMLLNCIDVFNIYNKKAA